MRGGSSGQQTASFTQSNLEPIKESKNENGDSNENQLRKPYQAVNDSKNRYSLMPEKGYIPSFTPEHKR